MRFQVTQEPSLSISGAQSSGELQDEEQQDMQGVLAGPNPSSWRTKSRWSPPWICWAQQQAWSWEHVFFFFYPCSTPFACRSKASLTPRQPVPHHQSHPSAWRACEEAFNAWILPRFRGHSNIVLYFAKRVTKYLYPCTADHQPYPWVLCEKAQWYWSFSPILRCCGTSSFPGKKPPSIHFPSKIAVVTQEMDARVVINMHEVFCEPDVILR